MSILDHQDIGVMLFDRRDPLSTSHIGRTKSGTDKLPLRDVANIVYGQMITHSKLSLEVELVQPTLDKLQKEYGRLSEDVLREIATDHALALLMVNIGYIRSYEDLIPYGFEYPRSSDNFPLD